MSRIGVDTIGLQANIAPIIEYELLPIMKSIRCLRRGNQKVEILHQCINLSIE